MRTLTQTFAVALCAVAFALPSWADLVGTNVTGSLTFSGNLQNFYDPQNGSVPPTGYENSSSAYNSPTVPISNTAIEFGFSGGGNLDVTDFTATGFTFSITSSTAGGSPGLQLRLSDPVFADLTLKNVFDNYPNEGFSFSLTGDTISVYSPGFSGTGDYRAEFTLTSAIPEPASFGLCFGLIALGMWRRRRAAPGRKLWRQQNQSTNHPHLATHQ